MLPKGKWSPRISFQNSKLFKNRLNCYREIATRTWPQNEHVHAICCLLEAAGDVISGENVKTIESYAALKFEVAIFRNFRDIKKIISWRRTRTSTIALSVNEFAFRLKIKASRDDAPRKTKEDSLRDRQLAHCRRRTLFYKHLTYSVTKALRDQCQPGILGNVMCPFQLDGVQCLNSYTVCQLLAKTYLGVMSPRVEAAYETASIKC